MSNETLVHTDDDNHGVNAVAFILCSVSGCLVGFLMGLAAAWL
jgi:hypothetical protein